MCIRDRYGILAVPTGIVTMEINAAQRRAQKSSTTVCEHCMADDHVDGAKYCYACGEEL